MLPGGLRSGLLLRSSTVSSQKRMPRGLGRARAPPEMENALDGRAGQQCDGAVSLDKRARRV